MAQDERMDQDEGRDRDERMDQDERKKEVAGRPKPIPIRDAVGESEPRSVRGSDGKGNVPTSQAPGLRGQRERPEGPRAKGSSRKRRGGGRRQPDLSLVRAA